VPASILTWYRIRLTRAEFESGEFDLVRVAFLGSFVARYGPPGVALYGGWSDEGDQYLLYFTPSARRCAGALFKVYSAEACNPPDLRRVQWLSGDSAPPASCGMAF
jgi:hypothetical protein